MSTATVARDIKIDVTHVAPSRREIVVEAFARGDVAKMMNHVPHEAGILFVSRNVRSLKRSGLYERALLGTYLAGGYREIAVAQFRWLFGKCDAAVMRSMGAQLPDADTVTLYRGVHSREMAEPIEYVRGISWTPMLGVACYFAAHGCPASCSNRTPTDVMVDPFYESFPFVAVYRAEVATADVLYRAHGLGGNIEWIVAKTHPERMDLSRADIFERASDCASRYFLSRA